MNILAINKPVLVALISCYLIVFSNFLQPVGASVTSCHVGTSSSTATTCSSVSTTTSYYCFKTVIQSTTLNIFAVAKGCSAEVRNPP